MLEISFTPPKYIEKRVKAEPTIFMCPKCCADLKIEKEFSYCPFCLDKVEEFNSIKFTEI
jgi:hypothetical protein